MTEPITDLVGVLSRRVIGKWHESAIDHDVHS